VRDPGSNPTHAIRPAVHASTLLPNSKRGDQHEISICYTRRVWEVNLLEEVERWFLQLCESDPVSADRVAEAIDLLAEHGPALGRPAVDRVKGSKFHHMKELRPGSSGSSEIRMIFAFDPRREAIILVAGDKSGAWRQWYTEAIPLADKRFRTYLAGLEGEEER
jgi:hypothetical protein